MALSWRRWITSRFSRLVLWIEQFDSRHDQIHRIGCDFISALAWFPRTRSGSMDRSNCAKRNWIVCPRRLVAGPHSDVIFAVTFECTTYERCLVNALRLYMRPLVCSGAVLTFRCLSHRPIKRCKHATEAWQWNTAFHRVVKTTGMIVAAQGSLQVGARLLHANGSGRRWVLAVTGHFRLRGRGQQHHDDLQPSRCLTVDHPSRSRALQNRSHHMPYPYPPRAIAPM
jgi:hypothetical protein